MPMQTFEDLLQHVKTWEGVHTVSAATLRDLYGAERLGSVVRSSISRKLASMGLAHLPIELPDRQHEMVRIYMQGSPVAELIEAALGTGRTADRRLRKAARGDCEKTLKKIRELLDEDDI